MSRQHTIDTVGRRLRRASMSLALTSLAGTVSAACAADADPNADGNARAIPSVAPGGIAMTSAGPGGSAPAIDATQPVNTIAGSRAPAPAPPVQAAPPLPAAMTAPSPVQPAAKAPAQMAPPVPAQVLVDAADEASCDGMGTPPQPNEEVEVLKIRTDDMAVVPGGFKAPGGTVYACFWLSIDMPEKHHIIGWEGAVNGDRAVHHQQVSMSPKPFYLLQQGGLCGLPTVEYTWTGEKPTEWTPRLAGYPIGGPENGGKATFLWQVHFESATTYTGGFNVYVTKNLRKYDAGNFEQGDVAGINIPPMAMSTHTATCTPDMMTQKLTHPIYVFAAMQHAHLLIRHIKTDLTRNGQLVKNFGDQQVQGFLGFFDQQFKPQSPCVKMLPGDQLTTLCEYQNPTNLTIMGGEATNQEMCTTFFQYFPRLPTNSQNFCGTIDSSGGFQP